MTDARNHRVIVSAGLLILTLTLAGCSHGEGAAATPSVTVVPAAHAIRTHLSNSVTLTAEFQPFFEVNVMAKEAGYIRHMNVDIGDRVKKGQILATLEIPELEDDLTRAKAGVQEATSEIAVANGDLHRAQAANAISHLSYTRILDVSRKEVGLVPLQEVDVAHSRDLESEAQVFAAEQRVEAAQNQLQVASAELARQQALVEYTRIVAPFDGVVTRRFASDGSMIQAGTASETQVMPVVTVAQNDVLRLMLPVPEENVGGVHNGQEVTVNVPSLNKSFPGKVTRFANNVQMATRTMTTEVDVKNPHLELIPGMYAEVVLQLRNAPNTVAVPLSAIDGVGTNQQVFVVDNNGVIHVRKVTTGIQSPQYIQILSGIAPGTIVITGEHSGYYDGQRVQAHFEPQNSSSSAQE
jgi:RND family efflux transporter MFP subunit